MHTLARTTLCTSKYSIALITLLILIVLLPARISIAATDSSVVLVTSDGTKYPAEVIDSFPLLIETSSLIWDPRDSTFYTTADKGSTHLVHFHLSSFSDTTDAPSQQIEILRASAIEGVDSNFDFEGITIREADAARYLMISTERTDQSDSLPIMAVTMPGYAVNWSNSFHLRPEGTAKNNNLEGVAYSPIDRVLYFGKEHSPYALYRYADDSLIRIFDERSFQPTYEARVDSIFTEGSIPDSRRACLKRMSISDLCFDVEDDRLLVLNREGRAVLVFDPAGNRVDDIWIYDGIDMVECANPAIPVIARWGRAEGLAVVGQGRDRKLAMVIDPGPGRPAMFYLFGWPGISSN